MNGCAKSCSVRFGVNDPVHPGVERQRVRFEEREHIAISIERLRGRVRDSFHILRRILIYHVARREADEHVRRAA